MTAPTLNLDTAEECARWLRVDVRTIRSWGRRGIVPMHDGLFVMTEVAAYVDKRAKTGRPARIQCACKETKIM
ncbi:MAG: hypothetical protein JWO67_2221 [Streptosporangiaceae bacterium]|nr:hypothetical protein [Streptosporangiaceae bacterium]